jgi:integrase
MRQDPTGKLVRPRVPRALPHPIADDRLLTTIADAPPRIRPWLVLAAVCGLRAMEIANLRPTDVLDTVSATTYDS